MDSQLIVLLAALVPCFVLMFYIYKHDKIEKEPGSLLAKLFFFGCLSTIPAAAIEVGAGYMLSYLGYTDTSIPFLIIENFFVVALAEEGCKRFLLRKGSWKNPNFNFVFDGVVYAVFVSLGFAGAENIGYIVTYGLDVALARALLSIPLHCICGVFMGHYYGMAKYYQRYGEPALMSKCMSLSIVIPVLIHGFYDFCASVDSDIMSGVFLIFVIVMDIIAIRAIKRYSASDTPL